MYYLNKEEYENQKDLPKCGECLWMRRIHETRYCYVNPPENLHKRPQVEEDMFGCRLFEKQCKIWKKIEEENKGFKEKTITKTITQKVIYWDVNLCANHCEWLNGSYCLAYDLTLEEDNYKEEVFRCCQCKEENK